MSIEKRVKVLFTASFLATTLLYSGCATRYLDAPSKPTDEMVADREELPHDEYFGITPKAPGYVLFIF
tara:strand:- start:478 stop:681 length:204 start_codon:yes stop_codon:yes gene_type:complete